MDIERLIKKRKALKAKLEFENRLERINDLIQHFYKNDIKYCIHIDCEKATKALLSYPVIFSGLDWGKISNSEKVNYDSIGERNRIISTTIKQYLDASDIVFVIWSDCCKPTLEISIPVTSNPSRAKGIAFLPCPHPISNTFL